MLASRTRCISSTWLPFEFFLRLSDFWLVHCFHAHLCPYLAPRTNRAFSLVLLQATASYLLLSVRFSNLGRVDLFVFPCPSDRVRQMLMSSPLPASFVIHPWSRSSFIFPFVVFGANPRFFLEGSVFSFQVACLASARIRAREFFSGCFPFSSPCVVSAPFLFHFTSEPGCFPSKPLPCAGSSLLSPVSLPSSCLALRPFNMG